MHRYCSVIYFIQLSAAARPGRYRPKTAFAPVSPLRCPLRSTGCPLASLSRLLPAVPLHAASAGARSPGRPRRAAPVGRPARSRSLPGRPTKTRAKSHPTAVHQHGCGPAQPPRAPSQRRGRGGCLPNPGWRGCLQGSSLIIGIFHSGGAGRPALRFLKEQRRDASALCQARF